MSAFLTIKEVTSGRGRRGRYPLSRGSLAKLIARGEFPAPLVVGRGVHVWSVSVLDEYDREQSGRHRDIVRAHRAAVTKRVQ